MEGHQLCLLVHYVIVLSRVDSCISRFDNSSLVNMHNDDDFYVNNSKMYEKGENSSIICENGVRKYLNQ